MSTAKERDLYELSKLTRQDVDVILKGIEWIEQCYDVRFHGKQTDAKPALLQVAKAAEAYLSHINAGDIE